MRAGVVEVEGDMEDMGEGLFDGFAAVGLDEEQEEAAAARTGDLAADGSGPAGGLVHGVNGGRADAAAEGTLELPAFVEETAEVGEIAAGSQDAQAFVHHRGHFRELLALAGDVLELLGDDFGGDAGEAGEEKEEGVLELLQALGGNGNRLDGDGVVGGEADVVEAAEGGGDLVLGADAVAAEVALDVDGLLGELHPGAEFAAQGVEGVEEADGEGGGGAQAGHFGQVAVVVDFDAVADAEIEEGFADGGVLDLLDGLDVLDDRIDDAGLVGEEGGQPAAGEVAVAGDGGGENGPAVFAIPGRIVGAAAEKGDAVGRARDDHARPAEIPK